MNPRKWMEAMMARSHELSVQEKKELAPKEEKTIPAKYYVPNADIFETDDALTVVMEIPGVEKKDVSVKLENEALHIEARIDHGKYEGLEPVYAEYNIGHYARAFTLSNKIDQDGISADLADGVLTLTLRKAQEAVPKRIPIK
jgi:HSP20 family protein